MVLLRDPHHRIAILNDVRLNATSGKFGAGSTMLRGSESGARTGQAATTIVNREQSS